MIIRNTPRAFSNIRLADDNEAQKSEIKHLNTIKELYSRLYKINDFKKGQFVKWKPGLKNRNFPAYGEAAIITKVMEEALYDPSENSAASPYFMEPLTLVIGELMEGDFTEYYVDGRRFELYDPQITL